MCVTNYIHYTNICIIYVRLERTEYVYEKKRNPKSERIKSPHPPVNSTKCEKK